MVNKFYREAMRTANLASRKGRHEGQREQKFRKKMIRFDP